MQPKRLPFATWLRGDSGSWESELSDAGFVQLFAGSAERPAGVFCFTAEAMKAQIGEALRQAGSGTGWEAKLMVPAVFAEAAAEELVARSVKIRKCVERHEPFVLRYDGASGKILVGPAEAKAAPKENSKTRILIVDDSATIRKVLEKIFAGDPEVEVVGSVGLPSEAEEAIPRLKPDVITLDIHLPEMNGVELLKRYFPKYRVPTVMISSISVEEGPLVLNALEAGAVDYIQKPSAQEIASVSPLLLLKVKTAAKATVRASAVVPRRPAARAAGLINQQRLVAVGSSTGGTEAIREIFQSLPANIPPILVTQHIPAVFSKAFAERLSQICAFEVLEGADGMEIKPGRAIIAPGGKQMYVKKRGSLVTLVVDDSPPVNRHKPSVDVLFESIAKAYGANAVGLILTGMGGDGARGLLSMRKAGAVTFGQDEATCVVYGMPMVARKMGATEREIALPDIADALVLELCRKLRAA